jgi:hypothetical protein
MGEAFVSRLGAGRWYPHYWNEVMIAVDDS